MIHETHIYSRRYGILAMFIFLSASNAMQWIEYSIIANIIALFYSISYMMVDWTSMVYMVSYMLFILPASWILDKYGLRVSVLLGAGGNCLGSWLKVLSAQPDLFWLSFLGQTIVGSSQVFILGIPPRLAAVWFGSKEISTACAAGVFGNQFGIAIGFLLPPLVVHMGTVESMATELKTLFMISAIINSIVFLLIIFFFSKKPPLPPSIAHLQSIENTRDYLITLKEVIVNPSYLLLLISYGLNTGVFYAISTLLNQIILYYHPNEQKLSGTIGLILVVSGMVGSVLCGIFLDRFHRYKMTTLAVYFFSTIGMILFTVLISLPQTWAIYIVAAILGFFMTGYLPIGFEFAAELTYPIPEGTTSGLLNASAQAFGVLMTLAMGQVIHKTSIFLCNIILSSILVIGIILTAFIKADLRRQKAHRCIQYISTDITQ
ncbi:unnamed protein product [Dracunculus medinensis]|uniref:MFS domain-containing protein n=1 Tax=Dracunculus medinensis TaxID=318479 RepID=A0A0N4URB2_DRAME|nr:unnamed protein product [Dracunculus medinensis]